MTLYKGKYRIESARLKDWDYATPGFYFVTVCTRQRENIFGEVQEGMMLRSPVGEIVAEELVKTETVRENVKMDTWIVMPNHLHAIIHITHRVETSRGEIETLRRNVSTAEKENPSRLKPNTLGSIVGQIKIKCTKRIRALGIQKFDWQERFWDEILWDEPSIRNVEWYIETNPANWERDKEKPLGLWM